MTHRSRVLAVLYLFALAMSSCGTPAQSTNPPTATPIVPGSAGTGGPAATSTPAVITPGPGTPQPQPTPVLLGPDAEKFPSNYNPLTGQPVQDLSSIRLPAMLISISNFPATARPQAGLSFASYVFEFSITEGATRFLSVFYGDFPHMQRPVAGPCSVRMEPFHQTSELLLGNRVWLDSNGNGVQDGLEPGIGGVCVNLYDSSGKQVGRTTTDSNGYYGFNASAGSYTVEVVKPAGMQFTQANVGDEAHDSDADPQTGRMQFQISGTDLSLDAGLTFPSQATPTVDASIQPVKPEVGPVRSGRLVYADFANMFQDSCLVYAFASEEVLPNIPTCAMVAHEVSGGGAMLPLTRMRAIAEGNRKDDAKFNYASNLFNAVPPAGGLPGTQLDVYFALLNQSGWKYDPLMQSYLRYTDTTEKEKAGQLHPDTDRLTGRQLHFENLIVLFAEHQVIAPTILDMDLSQGAYGPAVLFRDGQAYNIRWSTRSGEYEKKTGLRRPIQWQNADGSPFPLKPGHTWVLIVTPFSPLTDTGAGLWKLRFAAPEGSK
ncbi:MAG: SdrD B-like domain-containing protein [Bacteroidota bacterium]